MTPEKKERNEEIVRVYDRRNKKGERLYSLQQVADMFGMKARSTVHEIYTRTKEKQKERS